MVRADGQSPRSSMPGSKIAELKQVAYEAVPDGFQRIFSEPREQLHQLIATRHARGATGLSFQSGLG
jgi:hypothetical protein